MSALGQERTYAPQQAMSALSPIATVKADIRKRPCLLYPQKRTCAAQPVMSAMGHKRTSRRAKNFLKVTSIDVTQCATLLAGLIFALVTQSGDHHGST
jgi:hypothetical protein